MKRNNYHTQKRTEKGAVACAFFGNILFGLSIFFTKLALNEEPATPSVLLMWRFIIAFAVMNLLIPFSGGRFSLRQKRITPLLLLATVEPILYFVFESYGLMLSGAAVGAAVLSLVPVLTTILGAVLLGERPTMTPMYFSLLSVLGVILISADNGTSDKNSVWGIPLLMIAVLTAAIYYVLTKKLSTGFSAYERTYVMFASGALFFTLLAITDHLGSPEMLFLPFKSPVFSLSVAYLSLFSSVTAYLAENYAAAHLPVSRTASFTGIQSATAVLAGALLLGELPSLFTASAATLILMGVYGTRVSSSKRSRKERIRTK